jgi:hypothetical protein
MEEKMSASQEVILHSVLNFSDFVSEENATEIVDSNTFHDGRWKELCRQTNFPVNIVKHVVPVSISHANFIGITEVAPGSSVNSHSHDEQIFRLDMYCLVNLR